MPNNTVYNNRASSNIVYLYGAVNSGQPQEDDCCCPFSVVEDREDLSLISDPQNFDVTFIQNGSNGGTDIAIFLGGQWIIKSLKGAKGDKGEKGDTGDKGERGEAGQNGLNGANGQTGLAPKHRWDGTKLQFELPDGSWGTLVDLRGQDGTNGLNGSNGAKGDKPNHEWSGTELRFELPNGTWGVSVDLRGERGEKGDFPAHEWSATNEIRFQNPDGSWGAWQNIRGEKGDDGQNGIDGLNGTNGVDGLAPEHEIGADNRSIRFKNPDGSWGAWVVLTSDLMDGGVVYFDYIGLELPTSPVEGQMWYIPTYNRFYEFGVDWVVEASPERNKIYYYTPTNTLYARDEATGNLIILSQVVTKTSQIENDGEFGDDKYLEVGEANTTYQKLSEKGVPNGYAPLNEFNKILSDYLDIVDDLITGGNSSILSAEQGKELKEQIDAINLILTSDDINLDTVQELVNAIKEVETTLGTILVNDLTTGGVTKALTAEMGKTLKELVDALAIKTISVQNSAGVEQFKVNDLIKFEGVSFSALDKKIRVDPLVGGIIFVDGINGNDTTATIENRNKPYLTLNSAIDAFFANPLIDKIEIISPTSFSTNRVLNNGTTRSLELKSEKKCTVVFNGTGALNFSGQQLNFNLPNGSLNFTPVSGNLGFTHGANSIINFITDVLEFGLGWQTIGSGNGTIININSNTLNIKTTQGILSSPALTKDVIIKTNILNFRGAGATLMGGGVRLNLDFNTLTHDNTFSINNDKAIISHGSITSVSPYVITTNLKPYLGKNLDIVFKQGSVVNSNVTISMFNSGGYCRLSGEVNFVNSNVLFTGINGANSVDIYNAQITCNSLFNTRCTKKIKISSSTIVVTSVLGNFNNISAEATIPYETPTLEFIGTNYIFTSVGGDNLLIPDTYIHPNRPSVSTEKGILYTNGKFDRAKFDIYENPLNQYYDTTQRRNVIVNEKEEIVNKVLSPNLNYLIDGVIELLPTDSIIVPVGGLSLGGYGFDVSSIKATGDGSTIFTSPVGGCGNLFMTNISLEASGVGSKVFNLTNAGAPTGGADAIELNVVNFDNCTSLGELINFRQGLWDNIGIFGCKDGLTLSGTWSGGFRSDLVIVRNFGIASTVSTLFKKGTDLVFQSRFLTDINADFKVGGLLSNFDASNFLSNKLYQIKGAILTRAKVIDSTDNYTDTLNVNSSVCDWFGNIGLPNAGQVAYTDIEVNDPSKGLVLTSPDGTKFRMTVDNLGVTTITAI